MHTKPFPTVGPATFGAAPDHEPPTIELDMDAIYRAALPKAYQLEFECDGAAFRWYGKAKSLAAAELLARRELAEAHAGFSRFGARLMTSEVWQ